MSSAKTLPTHPSSIHYHTRTGRTLVYEIGDSANYGITLSQLPSNTEKMVTETFCAEEHVLARPETSKIIPPKLPPKLFHQLPSNIEERMKNCLHSSSEVINSYLSDSIEQLEKFTMPGNDTASVQSSSFKMPERQYHNSYNFSDDDFEDTLSLNFGVDDSFAVSEEFAKVLEETDSVFEELGDDDEFEDRWSISDEKVKRIVGIVKRHVPPSEVIVNHPPIVEYAPDPGPKSYDWLENDSFNFQLPSILNHRSEPLENQQPSSISYDHSPSVQDIPISPNSNRKPSGSSTPTQSLIPVQDISTSPASSRKNSGNSTPPAGSVLVNMIEDYVKMVMDVSKALGKPNEAPEVVSEGVSGVSPVSNEIEKQRETETRKSLEAEIEFEEDKEQELEGDSDEMEIEDQKVMFGPIAPRKSSVEKWESATLRRERPPSFEEAVPTTNSEKQGPLELSDISSQNVYHTEPLTLEDIIRIRRTLSESSTLSYHSEYMDALENFDQPSSQSDTGKSPTPNSPVQHDVITIEETLASNENSDTREDVVSDNLSPLNTNDDFPETEVPENKDNSDVDSLNLNNFPHLSFSHIGSVSDNGISESGISSNSPNVENRKEEESQFFRVSQEKECVYPDASPEAQIDGEVKSRNCINPQEDSQPHRSMNIEKEESDSISNKSFHSSPVSCEIEGIHPMLDEEFETSCDEFTKTDEINEEHFLGTEEEIQKLVENLLAHVKEEINNNDSESVLGEDLGEEENFSDVEADSDITEVLENLLSTVSQTEQRNEAVECILEHVENFRNDADVEKVEEADNSEEANELEDAPELDFGSEYNVEVTAGRDEDKSELVKQEGVIESVLNSMVNQLKNEETLEREEARDNVDFRILTTEKSGILTTPDEDPSKEPTFQLEPVHQPETHMENIHESDHNVPADEYLHVNDYDSAQETKDIMKFILDNLPPNQPCPAENTQINVQTTSTESARSETEEEIANAHESKLSDMETENVQPFDDISTEMDATKVLDYLLDCVARTSSTMHQVKTNEINLEDRAEHTPEEQAFDSLSDASRDSPPSTSASTKSTEKVDVETDAQNEQVVVSDHFADELADELADQLADQSADQLAKQFADDLADELADELADRFADELAERFADELADELADQLADELADQLADQLANELADDDAARLDIEEIVESEAELEIYEGSPEQENEADVLNVLQSVLNEVLYDLNDSGNASFSPDILDEAQSTSSSSNSLATELSTEAWEALQSVLDNLDVIIHSAEIRQIDEAVDFVQEPVENIKADVKGVEKAGNGLEDTVELDIKLEYDDQASTDLNDDLVQQGEVQETLNDIICIIDVVESLLLEVSHSMDSEQFSPAETDSELELGTVEVTHLDFVTMSNQVRKSVDVQDYENEHHTVEEVLQEEHQSILVSADNEVLNEEIVETVEILLNAVVEEEKTQDFGLSYETFSNQVEEYADFQDRENSNEEEIPEQHHGVLVSTENEEDAGAEEEIISSCVSSALEVVEVMEILLDGVAASDMNGECNHLEKSVDVEVSGDGYEGNSQGPTDNQHHEFSNNTLTDESRDLHESERHEKELQKVKDGVLVCAKLEEVDDTEEEVVETMEILLNGIVEEKGEGTAADLDGEGAFLEQIEDVEVTENGYKENCDECERQVVELPVLSENEKTGFEECSNEAMFDDDEESVDLQKNEHHAVEDKLEEEYHGVLVCAEIEDSVDAEEEVAKIVEILLNAVVEVEKIQDLGFSHETLSNEESVDLRINEIQAVEEEIQKANHDDVVRAEIEKVVDAEKQIVLSSVSSAVEVVETMEVSLNGIVEEEEVSAANTDGADVKEPKDGCRANEGDCEHREPSILEVNQKYAEGCSHEILSNQDDHQDFENEHHGFEQVLQEPNHGVLVSSEHEEVAYAEEEHVLSCVSSAVEVVMTMETLLDEVTASDIGGEGKFLEESENVEVTRDDYEENFQDVELPILRDNEKTCAEEGKENNGPVEESDDGESVAVDQVLLRVTNSLSSGEKVSDECDEKFAEHLERERPSAPILEIGLIEERIPPIRTESSNLPGSMNSATEVLLHFEDFCASYLENLISDQLLSAMASASTMLTSQLERQLEAEDIYSISPAVPSPLSDSYSTFPCVLKSSLNSLEPILEVEEIYSTPPGDLTDPRDAILEDETSQGRLSRLEEHIMRDQPRSPNYLFGSNHTKETSVKTVDDNQSFEIVDPDPQHPSEPSANVSNQFASISHLVSDIPTVSRSLVPESSRGDDNPDGHLNLPSSCQQLQIEKARPTPWGSSLIPESSDCSLCTDIYDPVPTNTNFSTETSPNSLNPSEHQPTSSVLEEVSHFLATACVAALVFVSPTESSDSTFNSDIIEDASKYITDSNSERTSQ